MLSGAKNRTRWAIVVSPRSSCHPQNAADKAASPSMNRACCLRDTGVSPGSTSSAATSRITMVSTAIAVGRFDVHRDHCVVNAVRGSGP